MRAINRTLASAAVAAGFVIGATALHAADALKPVEVKIAQPTRGEITRLVTLPGTLKANQQATLYAKVGGYLQSLSVDKGDAVRAGQVLGEIEVPELQADLVKFKAEVTVAETDFRRVSAAQTKSPDLVVPRIVDEALGRFDIARANLERTETLLRYAHITAPFAGVVIARFVDPGAFIPAATSGSTAQTAAIVTISDFNKVRAQVAVPEIEAASIRLGQPVRLSLEGLAGRVIEGQVSRFSYALDETTKTMLVEADLPNADLALRPGMFAQVQIGIEKHSNTWLLPVDGLVAEKTGTFVFKLEGGKARKAGVKVGFNDGKQFEVLTGVMPDDRIIVAGKIPLSDGQTVRVAE